MTSPNQTFMVGINPGDLPVEIHRRIVEYFGYDWDTYVRTPQGSHMRMQVASALRYNPDGTLRDPNVARIVGASAPSYPNATAFENIPGQVGATSGTQTPGALASPETGGEDINDTRIQNILDALTRSNNPITRDEAIRLLSMIPGVTTTAANNMVDRKLGSATDTGGATIFQPETEAGTGRESGTGGAVGGATGTGGLSGPFLNNLFGGFDTANLPLSEMRPPSEAAFGAVRDQYNLGGMAPFLENTIQSRAASSVPQFLLGTALGQYGQPDISGGSLNLGGNPIQGLIGQNALSGVQNPATSGSYIDFIRSAQQGLGGGTGQSEAIRNALGITGSESAQNAFDPIRTNFINPRISLLPQGIRDIFNIGVKREFEDLLGGRSSSEINPSDFLRNLINRGVIF